MSAGVTILGGGAFGTALACALGRDGTPVMLWLRDEAQARDLAQRGENRRHLPGVPLPETVTVTSETVDLHGADPVLLAVPAQALTAVLGTHTAALDGRTLIACCKGIDLGRQIGPSALIAEACPRATAAVLTGPSFAADLARGLPTALTLACADAARGEALQRLLATQAMRLYLSQDVLGAELGGALKNVIAIAAGLTIGAGLGESARAALITRGYTEMLRLALRLGARAETLAGLSGLGDLILTCGSPQSRNFRYGQALGAGTPFDPKTTVEGAASAAAVRALAERHRVDLPISTMVAAIIAQEISVSAAIETLLARPLKQE